MIFLFHSKEEQELLKNSHILGFIKLLIGLDKIIKNVNCVFT